MTDYQLRQREYLLQITRAMTSRLDLPSLLTLILSSAVDMLQGELGFIALRGSDGDLGIRASYGIPTDMLSVFSPFLTGIPNVEAHSHLPVWQVPDLRLKLEVVAATSGLRLRQVVALPLVADESYLGVIYVFRSTGVDFSVNDRQVLSSFADQVAIAVRNAQLYEEIWTDKLLLDAIIDSSANGIMILDISCHVVKINRSLGRMTGWVPEEAIGRPCHEVLRLRSRSGDEDICARECPLKELSEKLSPGDKMSVEGVIHIEQAVPPVTVEVTYTPLYDRKGNIINIVADVDDITKFREAEELKSTFISVVSHELKTPVALIKGYADTLRREDAKWDEATMRESLGIIVEESDHLNHLINNLLEASRIQAGGLTLKPNYFLLPPLIEKLVAGFELQTKIHQFEIDFPPNFPAVYADEERIKEVLSNLLGNAVKYAPSGGVISVGGRAEDKWVTVYVADSGIGIARHERDNIFHRFYRVENSLSRSTQGTGLGLYLSRAIVEAHGGRIWVESMPEKGSIFIFTLPQR
jgi:signal transduction histidine kinase